jgi:site-specific DNA-methyltransferase (adenine-specific)
MPIYSGISEMTHLSENCTPLKINYFPICEYSDIIKNIKSFNDVCMIILPVHPENERQNSSGLPDKTVNGIIESLGPDATLITIGDVIGLVHSHKVLSALQYHLWISIKRKTVRYSPDNSFLPHCHFGALVHTKYKGSLQHTLTRI